jgi:hypothetical protein
MRVVVLGWQFRDGGLARVALGAGTRMMDCGSEVGCRNARLCWWVFGGVCCSRWMGGYMAGDMGLILSVVGLGLRV